MKWIWAAAALAAATPPASPLTGTEPLTWGRYQHLTGVFDVGGPLPGGRLVVAGSQELFLLDPATGQVGTLGPEGGHSAEAYIAVSPAPALQVTSAGCKFPPGEVYQLQLTGSPGVTRVDAQGGAHP